MTPGQRRVFKSMQNIFSGFVNLLKCDFYYQLNMSNELIFSLRGNIILLHADKSESLMKNTRESITTMWMHLNSLFSPSPAQLKLFRLRGGCLVDIETHQHLFMVFRLLHTAKLCFFFLSPVKPGSRCRDCVIR